MQITMQDIRRVHFCSRGVREFFERHGMDWNKFIKEGLPEEEFLNTGDQMAKDVVEAAWEEARKNKQ